MALCDYKLCDICGEEAFYDECISDPHYVATWDSTEDCEPIGIAVLCAECNKTHETIVRRRVLELLPPDWINAPLWAQWLAQDQTGEWYWYKTKPQAIVKLWGNTNDGQWVTVYLKQRACRGHPNPDWRETLEKRPNKETQ